MNRIGKVVICPDKFKGGLSSDKVASAIREGLERYFPDPVEIMTVEMADGGDGSAVYRLTLITQPYHHLRAHITRLDYVRLRS